MSSLIAVDRDDRRKFSSISGRRINKSKIHRTLSKEYSVHSFVTTLDEIPFELKTSRHRIQPQILQRIETLQHTVYQRDFALKRRKFGID